VERELARLKRATKAYRLALCEYAIREVISVAFLGHGERYGLYALVSTFCYVEPRAARVKSRASPRSRVHASNWEGMTRAEGQAHLQLRLHLQPPTIIQHGHRR
jgi:hypothetical protein